jgi:hypothetical protein
MHDKSGKSTGIARAIIGAMYFASGNWWQDWGAEAYPAVVCMYLHELSLASSFRTGKDLAPFTAYFDVQ